MTKTSDFCIFNFYSKATKIFAKPAWKNVPVTYHYLLNNKYKIQSGAPTYKYIACN